MLACSGSRPLFFLLILLRLDRCGSGGLCYMELWLEDDSLPSNIPCGGACEDTPSVTELWTSQMLYSTLSSGCMSPCGFKQATQAGVLQLCR